MTDEMKYPELTEAQIESCAFKVAEKIKIIVAKDAFEKEFKMRSFSGRNPTLGPMIKCAQCGLRHRDNVKHRPIKYADKPGTPEGESNPMVAETRHFHPKGNPFWRSKPGKYLWIKELKKFVNLTR